MGKHTPGPWVMDTVATSVGICHKIGPFPPRRPDDVTSRSACLYADYPSGHNPADNELYANARLIAAAPDLLEALTDALEDYDAWMKDADVTPNESLQAWTNKARAAIARARGEE